MTTNEELIREVEWGLAEIVAIISTFLLLRSAWRNIPPWAKPAFLRSTAEMEADADGNLDNPFVICRKLKEMMDIAHAQRTSAENTDLPFRRLLGCFLALVHLWRELRETHPQFREEQYHDYEANRADGIPGRHVDPEQDDLGNMYTLMEYSDWAYLEDYNDLRRRLKTKGFELLRQDLATEPGRVGHYIAMDYVNKVALIGIKGTSHIGDIVTDLVAKSVPIELTQSPYDKDSQEKVEIRVHEGIWTASTTLANDLQHIVENLFIPGGFHILLVGHSLGAGTSCLTGLLLRSRLPVLQEKIEGTDQDRLRVVAFATPAVLNFKACVACAPFCTSVVNNSDIVPRASVSNLVIMNQLMVKIRDKVKGSYSDHAYKVAKNLKAFYRNLTDLMATDDETIMTPEEWDAFFDDTSRTAEVVDNLYVPGKVICLYERSNVDEDDSVTKVYGGVVADGAMKMLRQIEFTSSMVSDHSCSTYFETIGGFTKQTMGGVDPSKEEGGSAEPSNKKDD